MEEDKYKTLPTDEKCVHTLWKARLAGYEEAVKLFNQIDDEKSPEWNKYIGIIKKFVVDSNVIAQEKGLEAALVFVENCGHAGKVCGEVVAGIVAKCVASPRAKTKDLALQIILMYIEIEKQEVVQEELMKGMDQKNPKVVSACITAQTTALRQFGNKVMAIKPLVKKIPVLMADRDKGVRDEMKALVVEMHRWIGGAVEPHISSLQPVVQQELREMFSSAAAAVPTRCLRSQQLAAPRTDQTDGGCEDEDGQDGGGDAADADPFDFMDPVEILSKLPKDFYQKLEATKWQERKEALEALEALLKNAHKLEPGDYADLVRALKKMISKDSNVNLVSIAGRLLGQLAAGLRAKFQPYATACVQAILEKFKEKKLTVVTALRDAIDAIYPATNLEAIMEDMLAAFDNKNPNIKAETASFLARSLAKTQPQNFTKKLIKAYVPPLVKLLESADPIVRDAAAEALGTATKLVGEKNISPHIGKIDSLKEQKIKECAEKAVILVKTSAPKKEVKPKPAAAAPTKPVAGSTQAKPVRRPATAEKKGAVVKKSPRNPPQEQELLPEEVESKAEEILSSDIIKGLDDSNWKTRLQAVQSYQSAVQQLSSCSSGSQLLFKIINKPPGLRDTNVQVLKARLEATKYIAENFPLSIVSIDCVLQDIVTKLGETACNNLCGACLFAFSEACGLEHVAVYGLAFAMDSQKNPKVQAEMINWLACAIKDFGNCVSVKSMVPHLKKALSATNPSVRVAAVNLLGLLSLYEGPGLINHFDSEKSTTKQLISLEIDKYANSSPPTPTRSIGGSGPFTENKGSTDELNEEIEVTVVESAPVVEDVRPRTDIAPLITDSLIAEIGDKNWKVRNEGLEKLKTLISSSAPIKASLGELPAALVLRLQDSNSKLAQLALQICELLARALGPRCKQHVRTFFPAFFQAFGDSKAWVRGAALSCADAWCVEAGGAHVALDGEMAADAIRHGAPLLRTTLLGWLALHLPQLVGKVVPREELSALVPPLFCCVEDRAADVRKAAADAVLPVMLHLGYDAMAKHLEKLKPGSKTVVQAALDKARPYLPVQPLPTKAKKDDPKTVKSGGALKKDKDKKPAVAAKGSKLSAKSSSASSRSKKDDDDSAPLLSVNNLKNQRIIDDQKLKVLKWNFATPREEFFDLLKEQMSSAGFNKQLIANMFHSDFRYHLKAIELLSEDLPESGPALTSNLDLVLKWLTLRFFDTNPSVILKGLEYLSAVFQYLTHCDYSMPEYEANCFIPYLVQKVGDPKDTVRNGVKALFKQICVVYSVTKLFGYLMEGLKSKNARQRAECLECVGHLLESYGLAVMAPSPQLALKELARHIGDRDNAVRSAALNCVAGAYFLEGDRVYKMLGQISEKDMYLLEERIKRAGKSRSAEVRRSMLVPLTAAGKPMVVQEEQEEAPKHVISVESHPGADYEDEEEKECDEEEEEEEPEVKAPPPAAVAGPFSLDAELIARLDAAVPRWRRPPLPDIDVSFLDEPVKMPVMRTIGINRPTGIPMSQPTQTAPSLYQQQQVAESMQTDALNSMGSSDLNMAIRAVSQSAASLMSGGAGGVLEERFVTSSAAVLRRLAALADCERDDVLPLYKGWVAAVVNVYESGCCGKAVSVAALSQLLGDLVRLLGRDKVAPKLVRLLNNVCVTLLEKSPGTTLLCSIVSLLHESIGVTDPESPRYQELLLKCFWRILKSIDSWQQDSIDYDAVMYKIHLFYKAYPNVYWKNNAGLSDTPNKTVKTLVHTLVKMKGGSITNHLSQIPDLKDSDLYPYLVKVLKHMKLEEKKENNPEAVTQTVSQPPPNVPAYNSSTNSRLPRAVHEELANILNSMGNKTDNNDALEKLYELKERHPDVDIWTFMQGSSFFFRNYVERGLQQIAEQRRHPALYKHDLHSALHREEVTSEQDEKSAEYHLERLRALQAKAGMKLSSPDCLARSPMGNRVLTDSISENLPKHNIDPQLELKTSQTTSPKSEADVNALRLKLEQIKNSFKK